MSWAAADARRRPSWSGGLLLGGLLAALAAPLLLGVAPAAASESTDVEIRLTSLTGVLAPEEADADDDDADEEAGAEDAGGEDVGGVMSALTTTSGPGEDLELRLLVHNRGEEPVDGLRVVVEVHPAVADRAELGAVFDGDGPASTATVHQQDVRELAPIEPGEVAGIEEELTPEHVPWAEEGGVHPLRISLVRGAEVLDELTTAVVWLGEVSGEPLLTTLVWPISDEPWRVAQSAYPAGSQRDVRRGERLDTLLRGLELRDEPGVLLAPAPHLLEDLADQATGFVELVRREDGTRGKRELEPDGERAQRAAVTLHRLRELAAEAPHQPVAGAYAEADLVGLLRHGGALRELAGELATEGRSRLQRDIERSVDTSTFVLNAPITPEVLDLMPSQHLLVAPEVIDDPPDDARIHQMRSPSGRPLTLSVGDPRISQLLADTEQGGQLTAQRILAETAATYFAEPDVPDRTVALHPPLDWDPDPELVHALLQGIEDAPWLELVSPAQLVGSAQRAPGTVELAEPADERLPHDVAEQLITALDDLQAAVESWPVSAEEAPDRSRREMRTTLLRSTSRLLDPELEATPLIRDVQSDIDGFFGDVEVASGSQVTLTSESGQVPVTVRRTRGGPVTVRVEVDSQGLLVWDDRQSDDIVLADDEAHTVSFETRALGTGTFPVTVVVTDATGTRELERTTLRVRSTAVSGPALSATGVLVLVLLLVGALRRRPREPRLQVVDDRERSGT